MEETKFWAKTKISLISPLFLTYFLRRKIPFEKCRWSSWYWLCSSVFWVYVVFFFQALAEIGSVFFVVSDMVPNFGFRKKNGCFDCCWAVFSLRQGLLSFSFYSANLDNWGAPESCRQHHLSPVSNPKKIFHTTWHHTAWLKLWVWARVMTAAGDW